MFSKVVFPLVALSLAACAADIEGTPDVGHVEQAATPAAHWGSWEIPVCFLNPTAATAPGRAIIRRVAGEWEDKTRVKFSNWNTCTNADNPAIRIADDSRETDSFVGPFSTLGATMNFTITGMPDDDATRGAILHEFGHAIGLVHEHKRIHGSCRVTGDGPTTDPTGVGPYDDHSIMNYCGQSGSFGPAATHVSAWDAFIVNKLYGGSPGYFFSDSGAVFQLHDWNLCHVANPAQMQAFGGFGLITGNTPGGGTHAADCLWPDGIYRASDQATVWVINGGSVCGLESETQMTVYGGFGEVQVVPAGTDVTRGLPYSGTCRWPGGFYRFSDDTGVYRILDTQYCHVTDPAQMNRFGGFGSVWVVPYHPAGLYAGRTYTGACKG